MKNTITTLILALLLFSGCVNTPEENIPHEETICKIHYLNCNKLAKDENMSLDEYHKWQEEQEKDAQDEDNATNENGDIVGPEDEGDGRFVHIENDDNVASKNNISKQDEEDGIWGSFGRTQSIEKLKRISRECLYCGKKLTYGNIFYITSQGINGSRIEGIDCQDKNKNLREYNDKWSACYEYFCCKICIRAYHRDKNIELRD